MAMQWMISCIFMLDDNDWIDQCHNDYLDDRPLIHAKATQKSELN